MNNKEPVERLFHIHGTEEKTNEQPVLSIRVGSRHLAFSITNLQSGNLRKLAYYTAPEINEAFLTDLFVREPELNAGFSRVLVCYDHVESSMVPAKFFNQEYTGSLIQLLYGVDAGVTVIAEPVAEWPLYNVFAVPKEIHERLRRKFSFGKYWHQYTLAIKNLNGFDPGGKLQIEFRKDDFTVLAADHSNFLLARTYEYSTPADVLFYLLRICLRFGLSQEQVKLEVSGLVDQQSALYREIYQYFLNIQFRETDWKSEDPAHFFTSLNDLSRCAS